MKTTGSFADPSALSTAELLAGALREVRRDGPEDPVPHLVALHERPTREVFDEASRLVASDDPAERELGVRILRELGRHDDTGRRPFSDQAVPILVELLGREQEPHVLAWTISALGYNVAREALGDVLRLVDHPRRRVRFHVAAALPSLVDAERAEAEAVEALRRLCRDDDADIRYYALVALIEEVSGVDPELIDQTVDDLRDDPDGQIRELASTHLGNRSARPAV